MSDAELFDLESPAPAIMGTKSGPLLVVGTARCVRDDLTAAEAKGFDGDVMVINRAAYLGIPFQHHFSLHPDRDIDFRGRAAAEHGALLHSANPGKLINVLWPMAGSNSGVSGVGAGLLMGYGPVWLAGLPCDDSGRFDDKPGVERHYHGIADFWRGAARQLRGRVFSFSGLTRDLLGAP